MLARSVRDESFADLPSIEFCRAQYDYPIMASGVTVHHLVENKATERARSKDGKNLQRNNGGICIAPTYVGFCVL